MLEKSKQLFNGLRDLPQVVGGQVARWPGGQVARWPGGPRKVL